MSGIRAKDTKPELVIRRELYRSGFRYRLHGKKLPGRPDIVFRSRRAVIFIHGCFWHGHSCHLFKWPSSRPDFWLKKIKRNRENDEVALANLRTMGWRVLTIHECALKGKTRWPLEKLMTEVVSWITHGNGNMQLQGTTDGNVR